MEQTDQSGPRAFDQNGLAERWIASCRREILEHVIALNEEHLSRILREYIRYYHDDRLHVIDHLKSSFSELRPE